MFGKKPTPPKPKVAAARGHRGIAAGNLRARHEAEQRYRETGGYDPVTHEQIPPPYSQEEIDAWRTLGVDEVEGFLHNGEMLFVHSSNVAAAQYYPEEQKMMIEFLDGGKYLYSNISEQEALTFAQAPSKGRWCHTTLGHPNTSVGVRKPYTRI